MKKMLPPALCCLGFLLMPVAGQTVEWMSPLFVKNQTSEGQSFDSSWTFHLGVFENGFEATAENTTDWSAKWTSLDDSSYSIEQSRFLSTWENNDEVKADSKLFIWGVSQKETGMEWILMSAPDWKVPAVAKGPQALPFRISVSQASEVVLGEVEAGKAVAGELMMTSAPAEGPLPDSGRLFAGQVVQQISDLLVRALVAPDVK